MLFRAKNLRMPLNLFRQATSIPPTKPPLPNILSEWLNDETPMGQTFACSLSLFPFLCVCVSLSLALYRSLHLPKGKTATVSVEWGGAIILTLIQYLCLLSAQALYLHFQNKIKKMKGKEKRNDIHKHIHIESISQAQTKVLLKGKTPAVSIHGIQFACRVITDRASEYAHRVARIFIYVG